MRILSGLVMVGALVVSSVAVAQGNVGGSERWVGSWAAAPMDGDPWHVIPTVIDRTMREVVHTSIAGKVVRVRLTNEFGKEKLVIGAASVGVRAGVSDVQAGSLHGLTFNGAAGVVIPPGAQVISDPVAMAVPAMADLAISVYVPVQQITQVTVHSAAQQDDYMVQGNHVGDATLSGVQVADSWFFLKGVDVEPVDGSAQAVVAFGDSITDGAHAEENANHRWPDYLTRRLQGDAGMKHLAVLDEGIGANFILTNRVGPNALARFDRDVLGQAGVKYLVILEGINDIGALHEANHPEYKLTAEDLEMGMAQMVARAHEHGVKVIGGTILPYKGAGYYLERGEAIRSAVNEWIRTSGTFDGVADFDKAVRDSGDPLKFAAKFDSGDHLHPSDEGYEAMAGALDLGLFR